MSTGIYINIGCYAFMAVTTILILESNLSAWYRNKRKENAIRCLGTGLLFTWSAFMVVYLISDYENIVSGPLNVRLNFFESITNFILPIYLIFDTYPQWFVRK
jgi:bacteriorhodopsin